MLVFVSDQNRDFWTGRVPIVRVYILVQKQYPPPLKMIFSPSRDMLFFDSYRTVFAFFLPYFEFIVPVHFSFSIFLSLFFLFFWIFPLFLCLLFIFYPYNMGWNFPLYGPLTSCGNSWGCGLGGNLRVHHDRPAPHPFLLHLRRAQIWGQSQVGLFYITSRIMIHHCSSMFS